MQGIGKCKFFRESFASALRTGRNRPEQAAFRRFSAPISGNGRRSTSCGTGRSVRRPQIPPARKRTFRAGWRSAALRRRSAQRSASAPPTRCARYGFRAGRGTRGFRLPDGFRRRSADSGSSGRSPGRRPAPRSRAGKAASKSDIPGEWLLSGCRPCPPRKRARAGHRTWIRRPMRPTGASTGRSFRDK